MARVGSYFYDRRQDSENFSFDRFCPISTDDARTLDGLEAKRIQRATVARDRHISQSALLRDYENMAGDFTGVSSGWSDLPDHHEARRPTMGPNRLKSLRARQIATEFFLIAFA